ncbi:hypothetical protein vseg_013929 [Gypsophila vaccaria]
MQCFLAKLVAAFLAVLFVMLSFAPPITLASIQDGKQSMMAAVSRRSLREGSYRLPPSPTWNMKRSPYNDEGPPPLRRFL